MSGKQVYEYVIIRLVPKVEREEFLNIGVIVFCKRKRYLGIKYHIDEKRLALFNEAFDIEILNQYLHTWTLITEGNPEGGRIASFDQPERFRWLAAPRSTIIQSSPIHVGICETPEDVLEALFEKYVL